MWRVKSYDNPVEEPFGLFLILKNKDNGMWENAGRILQADYLAGATSKPTKNIVFVTGRKDKKGQHANISMTVSIGDFSAATSDSKVQDFKVCESDEWKLLSPKRDEGWTESLYLRAKAVLWDAGDFNSRQILKC